MKQRRRGRMSTVSAAGALVACLMMAAIGVAQSVKSTFQSRKPGTFRLNVTGGHVSLEAKEASVAKIFEEIGRQTGIEVDIQIGPEEKVTARFDRVPLKDAPQKITENVVIFYSKDPTAPSIRIAKIGVYSKGQPRMEQKRQFEPAKGNQAEPAKSKAAPRRSEQVKSSKIKPPPRYSTAKEKTPRPEPFKFTFDPSKYLEKPR